MSLFVSRETLQDWEGGKRNLILRLFEREEYDVYYTEGHVGYHRRTGKHAMTPFDWTSYTETLKRI